jgi:hypothetical protein
LIDNQWIKGLGISYRKALKWNVPVEFIEYENSVFHVICGIDSIEDVISLRGKRVRKILILGEKDFGFNTSKVNLESDSHKSWVRKLHNLSFDVISFDNLALQQLPVKNQLSDKDWGSFYQSEHSFYINAVDKYLSPSSRSSDKSDYFTNFKSYYEHRRIN